MASSAATELWATFAAAPKQIDMPLPERRAAGEQAESVTSEPEGVNYEDAPDVGGLVAIPDPPVGGSVLYLFGGGYVLGSPASRRKTAGHVAHASGARVLVPNYRVAPEHPFPAAVDDAVAAYRHLLATGASSDRAVVMGDSSGGGLAVATLLALRDAGDALPAGVVTMSAWADLRCAGSTMDSSAGVDIMCSRDGLLEMAGWYLAGTSATEPLASPVYADLAGLPPLLALVGGDEVLLDDSVRLLRGFGEGGADATLFVGGACSTCGPPGPARSPKPTPPSSSSGPGSARGRDSQKGLAGKAATMSTSGTTSAVTYRPLGRETWRDPFPMYRRLRDEDPVHRSPHGYWVLTRFQDVYDTARDTATFSSAQGLTFHNEVEALGLAPTIVMMDPPDHTRYRRLVNRGFTPRHVEELEPEVRRFVAERVDRLRAAGSAELVAGLARPLPNWVVSSYLGVPAEDRHRFEGWTQAIVQANAQGHATGAGPALAELYGYFTELIDRRRRAPGDDLVSILLRADDDGAGIGVEGILGYAFVMIAGGNDTTTGLLAGAAELLSVNPQERARLVEDPSRIPNAVEEILRLTSPVQGLCRVATRDCTIEGTTIAPGDRVLLCYGAANRDPREFAPDAEELDVGRSIQRLLAFSSGAHFCLGAAAARLQGRVVLEELLQRCPDFTVDADGGVFADGAFTRRYESLPFRAGRG